MKNEKICFVVPVEYVVDHFLLNHLRYLSAFYDVTVVLNSNQPDLLFKRGIDVKVFKIPFQRGRIFLLHDLFCFFKLFFFIKSGGFKAVHSVTPKVGVVALPCALLAGVAIRIHIFTGQTWADETGFRRFYLKSADMITGYCANYCLVDSPSQKSFLIHNKVISKKKSFVFGSGSISGVDLSRFKFDADARSAIRGELSIPLNAFCLVFVGRLSEGKGILDLVESFSQINNSQLFLMIVGPDEGGIVKKIFEKFPLIINRLKFIGYTYFPEHYMSAADVLCLPSYKEGFGSVIIEAAAVGIPTIASNIYGITDAVIDGQTGILHKPKDIHGIKMCIEKLLENPALLKNLSENAYKRTVDEFDSNMISQYWLNFYLERV